MGAQHYYFGRLGTTRGDPSLVHVECTFSSGSPTVDTAQSDPGITITRDAAGDYDVAGLPTGQLLHPVNFTLDLAADAPADTTVGYAQPRSVSASAGTCKILTFARDDGDQDDPPDGARLFATFLASEAISHAQPWTPASIPAANFWVDGASFEGVGTVNYKLFDKIGALHFLQGTVASQPLHSGGVMVNGDGDFVRRSGSSVTGELSKFTIAARFNDTGGATGLEVLFSLGHPGAGGSRIASVRTALDVRLEWYSVDNTGTARRVDIPFAASTSPQTLVMSFDATAATDALRARAWVNGVEVTTTKQLGNLSLPSQALASTDQYTIFAEETPNREWVGNMEWLVFVAGEISDDDRKRLGAWRSAYGSL